MALPLVYHLEEGNVIMSLVYIVLIVISDLIDGAVARRADEITNFGKLIDPVADKVCMMVVLIYLLFEYKTPFFIFITLLGIRDISMILTATYLHMRGAEIFQSLWSGKWFLGISAFMMFLYVINKPEWGILIYYPSLLLMFISTYFYFKNYLNHMKKLEA